MDRSRVTRIAHSTIAFAGPYDERSVDRCLQAVKPGDGAELFDAGCGQAEFLMRVLDRFPFAIGVGVDRSVGEALQIAEQRGLSDRLTLIEMDIEDFDVSPSSFDLMMCVGSTHIYGGLDATLDECARITRRGGFVIVGEGFWERDPDEKALKGLGATREEFTDLAGITDAMASRDLLPLVVEATARDVWDRYESAWCDNLEAYARSHPDDADASEMLGIAEEHRHGYYEGYRDSLGFALVTARRL